ncbi:MAG: electron transfer flavoprotein subunit alpha [Candidatus Marinimicrobia bacterium]|jgi:electron transfer flavoprotein alpha subunit|nr:electron transfer flavoprotein subunit alpha [Candidatus Neomarinimicrobiota bacterium]|tara:strand:+ start:1734 stop:2663 length:930 start_codon:yes stop_codon:yes gene_type:complete
MGLEALAAGQKLASEMNLSLSMLVMGKNGGDLAENAGKFNAEEVLLLENPLLDNYSSDGYSQAITSVLEQEKPRFVFMGHTYMVRDFLPRVSARLRIPFISDVVQFRVDDGNPVFTKQVFNAKLAADIVSQSEGATLVSLQSAAYQSDQAEAGAATIRSISIEMDSSAIKTQSEEPFKEEAGGVDLTNAEIIVSIGRGIGKEENLPIVNTLVDALGAELGSSRPIVDSGWLEPSRQIGSSGQNVAPKLYLALGISGAIQHVVGMKGSKNIVAVNKDSEAPIFEIADYGIVGDILEIIPKLSEAVEAAKN